MIYNKYINNIGINKCISYIELGRRTMKNINDSYTFLEASKYMGVTRSMIYYWVKKGRLKVRIHKVSGKKYFLKHDLERLKLKLQGTILLGESEDFNPETGVRLSVGTGSIIIDEKK